MVARAALGSEHTQNGLRVGRVCGKTVDRLGGHRHHLAGPQYGDRETYRPVTAVDHPGSIAAADDRGARSTPLPTLTCVHASIVTMRRPSTRHERAHPTATSLRAQPSVRGSLNCTNAACLPGRARNLVQVAITRRREAPSILGQRDLGDGAEYEADERIVDHDPNGDAVSPWLRRNRSAIINLLVVTAMTRSGSVRLSSGPMGANRGRGRPRRRLAPPPTAPSRQVVELTGSTPDGSPTCRRRA